MASKTFSPAAKVSLSYCLLAIGWIVGTDGIAEYFFSDEPERLQVAQTYKGLLFVALMTGALYCIVARVDRLEKRNRQVEAMLRVSERLETIGSLAATLVHDLNNMLAVIRGFTDLARLEHGRRGSVGPERLADIEGAVVRANTMVRQLSLFLQQGPNDAIPLDVAEVIEAFEPLLQQAATRRVHLQIEAEPSVPRVCIARGLLEQALLNLVVNARDAMENLPRRELRIAIEACQLHRHLAPHHAEPVSGPYVRIRVMDTGVGIPPEQLVRVFDPFFTTKAPGHGTGLGLPSVVRTAQQHGGWVEVASQPRQGACFDIYLPPAAPPPAVIL